MKQSGDGIGRRYESLERNLFIEPLLLIFTGSNPVLTTN